MGRLETANVLSEVVHPTCTIRTPPPATPLVSARSSACQSITKRSAARAIAQTVVTGNDRPSQVRNVGCQVPDVRTMVCAVARVKLVEPLRLI
jgi:hypothetical protein